MLSHFRLLCYFVYYLHFTINLVVVIFPTKLSYSHFPTPLNTYTMVGLLLVVSRLHWRIKLWHVIRFYNSSVMKNSDSLYAALPNRDTSSVAKSSDTFRIFATFSGCFTLTVITKIMGNMVIYCKVIIIV